MTNTLRIITTSLVNGRYNGQNRKFGQSRVAGVLVQHVEVYCAATDRWIRAVGLEEMNRVCGEHMGDDAKCACAWPRTPAQPTGPGYRAFRFFGTRRLTERAPGASVYLRSSRPQPTTGNDMTLIRTSYAFAVRLYRTETPSPLITGITSRAKAERIAKDASRACGVDADVHETRVDVYATAPGIFESRAMPVTTQPFYVTANRA